jgi:hypothetical protein
VREMTVAVPELHGRGAAKAALPVDQGAAARQEPIVRPRTLLLSEGVARGRAGPRQAPVFGAIPVDIVLGPPLGLDGCEALDQVGGEVLMPGRDRRQGRGVSGGYLVAG